MNTVGDAIAEGYHQLVIDWSEPTRQGAERVHLSGVSVGTELNTWAPSFAASKGHDTVTGACVTRPRTNLTAPLNPDERFLWGRRSS